VLCSLLLWCGSVTPVELLCAGNASIAGYQANTDGVGSAEHFQVAD